MKLHNTSLILLSALAMGCGRDATITDYKLAGVGLNPEEIAPAPEMYGGFASYDYIEFAGGALPLGLVGLVSFSGAGPALGTFEPPYGMVFGSGFFFESSAPSPDALFGSFASAPVGIGNCHTVYEPRSYLSGIADGGTSISFRSEAGDGFDIGRRPLAYPTNAAKVFPYYSGLSTYKDGPRVWRNPMAKDATDLASWNEEGIGAGNFPFGQEVSFSFKGAIPPESATFGSIPQAYSSEAEGVMHVLPSRTQGLMVSWNGPRFSGDGVEMAADGDHSACMQYSTTESENGEPVDAADCIDVIQVDNPKEGQFDRGQMYTGPWDTTNGVTIKWIPSEEAAEETVSISVRFLGTIDETDDSFVEEVVMVKKNGDVQGAWDAAIRSGTIPESAADECPEEGSRPALPCDEDISYEFDQTLKRGDGYIPSMQGNPLKNLVETTCTVQDAAGEFVITEDLLEQALTYAKQHKAKGAIFYFNRTTKTAFDVPPVRDAFGTLKEPGEFLVVSNSVQLGRFWVQDGAFE
jgi:hypothetical protein